MGRIRFYLDEQVARAVASGLRRRGVDLVTVREAGSLGAADEEHVARALAEKRVIFTQDTDFLRLHAGGTKHAGIVYAPQGIGSIIRGLVLIHQLLEPEEMTGNVEFL